jgi:hypothetical protein
MKGHVFFCIAFAVFALARPLSYTQQAAHLTEDDVCKLAATELKGFERSYQQERPLYDALTKVWQVRYHFRIGDRLAKEGFISIWVDDTTGHASRQK